MASVIFLPERFAERKHKDKKIAAVCIKRIMNMKEVVGLQKIFLLLQVHEALSNAVKDAVYGKTGIVNK